MVFVDIYTLSDFWASGRNLSIKSIIIIIIIQSDCRTLGSLFSVES